MKNILTPGVALMNRLKYPQKFLVISSFFLLFIIILIFIIFNDANTRANKLKLETSGVKYVRLLSEFLQDIQNYRSTSFAYLSGDESFRDNVLAIDQELKEDIKQINNFERGQYNKLHVLSSEWNEIAKSTNSLIEKRFELTPNESFSQHTEIINKILELINETGSVTGLILDSQINTYYLTDSILNELPRFTELLGLTRGLGTAIIINNSITEAERIRFITLYSTIDEDIQDINENFEKINAADPATGQIIRPTLDKTNNLTRNYLNLISSNIINNNLSGINSREYINAGTSAISANFQLLRLESDNLTRLINKRLERLNFDRLLLTLSLLTTLAIITYLFFSFYESVVGTITTLQKASERIANGDFSKKAKVSANDEVGNLADSLNTTADKLNTLISSEKLLRSINNQILYSKDLTEAVSNITQEIGKLFNADRVTLRFFDKKNQQFSQIISEYLKSGNIPHASIINFQKNLNAYFLNELFTNKSTLIIDNIKKNYPAEFENIIDELNIKSLIAAPLFYLNKPIGAIFVLNLIENKGWSSKDIEIINSIASQTAIGINLLQINERLKKSVNYEQTTREILEKIGQLTEHDQIFGYILEKLLDVLDVNISLHMHTVKGENLIIELERTKGEESYINQILRYPEKPSREMFSDLPQKVIAVNNIDEDIQDPEILKSYKAKKLVSFMLLSSNTYTKTDRDEKVIGITLVSNNYPRIWTEEEKDFFKLLIETTTTSYYELKQRQELEEIRRNFIATLTHDLRSPIIAEQKALEIVLASPDETQLIKYKEYIEDIYKTNEELLRLVNNLLTVFHMESGKIELSFSPESIKDIINDSVRTTKYLAQDQSSKIITDIEEDLSPVYCERSEITRVITNLISNAIKHNRKYLTITVSAVKAGSGIMVSVKDDGIGIKEADKSKIFQRYPTAKRKIGTGLGLYLSKEIVELHNGKIWFESKENEGTTFFFTLPFKQPEAG